MSLRRRVTSVIRPYRMSPRDRAGKFLSPFSRTRLLDVFDADFADVEAARCQFTIAMIRSRAPLPTAARYLGLSHLLAAPTPRPHLRRRHSHFDVSIFRLRFTVTPAITYVSAGVELPGNVSLQLMCRAATPTPAA